MRIKGLLRNKAITIAQQSSAIKAKYFDWRVEFDAVSLVAVGKLRPTPRSEAYEVEVRLGIKKNDSIQVRILSPKLVANKNGGKIPHMYLQKTLCLFMPKYAEFKKTDYISNTIIPWTSLWLYYYELWHSTGKWLGGGEHPNL